jgi:hypothetical protein
MQFIQWSAHPPTHFALGHRSDLLITGPSDSSCSSLVHLPSSTCGAAAGSCPLCCGFFGIAQGCTASMPMSLTVQHNLPLVPPCSLSAPASAGFLLARDHTMQDPLVTQQQSICVPSAHWFTDQPSQSLPWINLSILPCFCLPLHLQACCLLVPIPHSTPW